MKQTQIYVKRPLNMNKELNGFTKLNSFATCSPQFRRIKVAIFLTMISVLDMRYKSLSSRTQNNRSFSNITRLSKKKITRNLRNKDRIINLANQTISKFLSYDL